MALIIAQLGVTLFLALWMTSGVRDNILCPDVNRDLCRDVLAMTRLSEEYPEIHAVYVHRALSNERHVRLLFGAIVALELIAAILLWCAAVGLGLAVLGGVGPEAARGLAILACLAFTSVWASFLIAGNYWCYWMCHVEAQATHFKLALMGLGGMILLAV